MVVWIWEVCSGNVRLVIAQPAHNAAALKPPLKWAGGKRWLLPHLLPLWTPHAHRRLVEPFCGGLAVTLGLRPARALLNDINPHLVSFYQWLQRGLTITVEMANDADLYYRQRARFNALIAGGLQESREAAELFYYLNRTGYNGLCRFNKGGGFNVPFGRYRAINYTRDFSAYRAVLAPWQFTYMPFQNIATEPDDLIYADPPYDVQFTSYTKEGFTWQDQEELAQWLAARPGPVIASNQATPRIVALYTELGFSLHYVQAPRLISSSGDRTPAREMLATRGLDGHA